ncbi:MAG: histidine phosphatase family protein [Solirubrobacteraceae bacterium]
MSDPLLDAKGRIVVVRHGETEWSMAGKHTGRSDPPLAAVGRRRATALAAALGGHDFERVLCSPLERARETCELAGFGLRAEICEDLREWDYGDYEGLTSAEIRARAPDWNLWRDGAPGGELPAQVGARADLVLAMVRTGGGGDMIAFAHGHLLRVLAARWIGLEVAGGRLLALSAAGIGVLGHERDTPVIERWNAETP